MKEISMDTWLEVARMYTHNKRLFMLIFKNAHGKVAVKRHSTSAKVSA
jgi:hypothetical protein